MKIFISWSGRRSRLVAELLSDWIKCVLQASRPWISTRDIDRGSIWFTEISDQLKDTVVGIVCLTQENKNKPWILFESGALAKGLSTSRVCTLLIDLTPSDIEDPLAQFNHTLPERDSMWALVRSLNSSMNDQALDERILSEVFNTYWNQFFTKFKKAIDDTPQQEAVEPRSESSILEEILGHTRTLSTRISRLEKNAESEYFAPPSLMSALRKYIKSGVSVESIYSFAKEAGIPNEILESELKRSHPNSQFVFAEGISSKS
ncbi:hypothetical protein [Pseudomonas sp. LRF_L74]|uniref:hypothetical protein n=1 Tax=Pseudomonas sp. LRF_L74 TaxID=3369422 RepID=UPI003F639547